MNPGFPDGVTADLERERQVRAALERVLASADFSASPRLAAFLRFVVEATLDGRAEAIKGYTIAVEALGRPTSFDPQADPIVRVEATRLRRALERYYATQGTEDPVVIDIPKGGYVPRFLPRAEAGPEDRPAADQPGPAGPADAVPAPAPRTGSVPSRAALWRLGVAASFILLAAGAALFALPSDRQAPAQRSAMLADAVRLPIVEVRPIEAAGSAAPAEGDLRAIEERMRDAFARFDFVEVKAAGASAPEGAIAEACNGPRSRSVFSLAALAEGRADGTFSLVARLTDRCDGSIVWSAALDGLAQGAGLAESERRVVHDIAAGIMETYGVIPVRARTQALARAPASGYGCIAGAVSLLRQDAQQAQRAVNVNGCLADLTKGNPDFALGHAVRAMTMLYTMMREGAYSASDEALEGVLDEAERAVDLAPASAYATRTLALVQLFAGEPAEAVTTAQKALELNPLDFDVAAAVATVYIGAGRIDEGEALLQRARREGAVRSPLQDAFLGFAAFMRDDVFAAQSLVPQLALHPGFENKLALSLVLHALGRGSEEREALASLVRRMPEGADGVRQMVHRLLPSQVHAQKALDALETAGLSREAVAGKPPRG